MIDFLFLRINFSQIYNLNMWTVEPNRKCKIFYLQVIKINFIEGIIWTWNKS